MKRTSKFWAQFSPSRAARSAAVLVYLGMAFGCGGRTDKPPTLGSESHFLSHCDTSCNNNLASIAGLCTRACIVGEPSCGDLALQAECTNESVETGAVAVCDLGCIADSECQQLDPDFLCSDGYCRARAFSGDVTANAQNPLVCDFSGPNAANYEVCGLNEQCCTCGCGPAGDGCSREEACEAPQGIACGTRTCNTGDVCCAADLGLCANSEPECAAAKVATCDLYREQTATLQASTTITNASDETLYIQQFFYSCGAPLSLVELRRDGLAQNYYGEGCSVACDEILDTTRDRDASGANATGSAGIVCQGASCLVPALVEIRPGQSYEYEHPKQEFVDRRLPQVCAPGLTADFVYCTASIVPETGDNYQFTVRAFRELQCAGQLLGGTECLCDADANGVCTGSGASASGNGDPLIFSVEGDLREDQTILLQVTD